MRLPRLLEALRGHVRTLLLVLAGVVVPAVGLALLAEDVWTHEGFAWDRPIQRWAHAHASSTLDAWMVAASRAGYGWGLVPLCALGLALLLARGRHRSAAFLGVSVLGAFALDLLGKIVFQRIRPDLWTSPAPESSYSFPSGHATFSAAVAAAVLLLAWRTRWRWVCAVAGALFALVVGYSRVYLGVHYPSDIVAGWALSVGWVVGVWLALRAPGLDAEEG